jgi:hypothetical protein
VVYDSCITVLIVHVPNERCPILLIETTREVLLEVYISIMDIRGKVNQTHGKGFWKEAKGKKEFNAWT